MTSRVVGALIRAFMVVLLIITPSLMLPGIHQETSQIVALAAIFGFALTTFEYASTYPGLVEFREAPPFNRIRFFSLFITVILLSTVARGNPEASTYAHFVAAIGSLIGNAIDFPYSPVRLIVLMLPEGATAQEIITLRMAAGMSYLISLVSLAIFIISLRVTGWPKRRGGFNVWVNLPMFDPTAGGDVVDRLERDARFNVALGFLLPFITPAIIKAASGMFGSVVITNDQTMIWTISAWAFLPASLFMRGIAMQRVATLICEQRARNSAKADAPGLQPA
ncbi:hypothetical protein [Maritimibacter dapengensis]|uniref:Uncharacterized protein n=1 Tax=Maritimibacter dapengensis TaxID=2836868 RepID=A0ABS6T5T7_9RHOB|nr:hypothetical protein [Maritimibacter dapengensis]MBV7379891.1 hypothetical protein [Maritimibacter dapengensis]